MTDQQELIPLEIPVVQRREYDNEIEAEVCEKFLRMYRKGRRSDIELTEYAKLVKEMRDTQNEYFKTRSKDVLVASKRIELKVDQRTREILLRC